MPPPLMAAAGRHGQNRWVAPPMQSSWSTQARHPFTLKFHSEMSPPQRSVPQIRLVCEIYTRGRCWLRRRRGQPVEERWQRRCLCTIRASTVRGQALRMARAMARTIARSWHGKQSAFLCLVAAPLRMGCTWLSCRGCAFFLPLQPTILLFIYIFLFEGLLFHSMLPMFYSVVRLSSRCTLTIRTRTS